MSTAADKQHPPRDGADGRTRFAIDVRVFLVVITTAMALAFGAGVSLGPSPADLAPPTSTSSSIPNGGGNGRTDSPEVTGARRGAAEVVVDPSGSVVTSVGGGGGDDEVIQPRRVATGHSVELGSRVDSASAADDDDGKAGAIREKHVNLVEPSYEDLGSGAVQNPDAPKLTVPDEEHLPQGQHLLLDIKNVDGTFLDSEDRLSDAMTETVKKAGLTLLSYHCHSLQPRGVSCAGILLESHISFHTWPEEGVITIDLFTCGAHPLVPMVPVVEKLFGIPRTNEEGENEQIKTLWAHDLRGFRHPKERKKDYLDDVSDLASWVLSPMEVEMKKQIVSTVSKYQRIDIWDIVELEDTPSYEDAIRLGLEEGDPRWLTNEICAPARLLFLDGTLQSDSNSEREYHETLVHPAMFAHPSPRRVAIVGGGEGATLREVLKHRTVEQVVMIELDEQLVQIAREHLPYMNNCSDLIGRADNCLDDARARLTHNDAVRWFTDRFGGDAENTEEEEEKFDVVVLDALDPEEDKAIANRLYTDDTFLTALYESLTPEGVVVVQVGTAPSIHDPKADKGVYERRELMFNLLEGHAETAAMLVYEEAHCGFNEPHSFLVVCKSSECRRRWYAEPDAVDFWIYERIVRTKSGERPLFHYDGATQWTYQVPPRAWETVYCRREPEPFECAYRGLDFNRKIFDFAWEEEGDEESCFEVRTLKDDESGEERTAVFALVDIPAGSYVMPNDLAASLAVREESLSNLRTTAEIGAGAGGGGGEKVAVIEDLLSFIDEHSHSSMAEGRGMNYVEVGGTFLMRRTEDEGEANVGRWIQPHPSGKLPAYSPVYERHMKSFDLFLVATRDIKKGEEVVKHEKLWD